MNASSEQQEKLGGALVMGAKTAGGLPSTTSERHLRPSSASQLRDAFVPGQTDAGASAGGRAAALGLGLALPVRLVLALLDQQVARERVWVTRMSPQPKQNSPMPDREAGAAPHRSTRLSSPWGLTGGMRTRVDASRPKNLRAFFPIPSKE